MAAGGSISSAGHLSLSGDGDSFHTAIGSQEDTVEHTPYSFLGGDLLSESWASMDSNSPSSLQKLALYTTSPYVSGTTLLAFRSAVLVILLIAGYVFGWGLDVSWTDGNPPPVFLTNWGLTMTTAYFFCTSCLTVLFFARRKGGFATTSSWLGIGPSRRLRAVLSFVQVAFEISLTLEPLIAVGFWSLVYPSALACSFPSCYTVHVGGALFIAIDASLNQLRLHPRRNLSFVLGYSALWLVTQIIWVYTGHDPDYDVFTLRDRMSIVLAICGFIVQALIYFALCWLLNKKPRPQF